MDYSKYPPNWRDTIRPAILARDEYKCRVCSIAHRSRVYANSRNSYVVCDEFIEQWAISQGKKVFTIYLQVAHIDNVKENCDPSNLLSLCPRCHGKRDKDHKALIRKVRRSIQESGLVDSLPENLEQISSILKIIAKEVYSITAIKLNQQESMRILDALLSVIN